MKGKELHEITHQRLLEYHQHKESTKIDNVMFRLGFIKTYFCTNYPEYVLYIPELDGQDLTGKFVAICKMDSDGVPENLDEEILYGIYDEHTLEELEITGKSTLRKFISTVYPRFIHYLNEVEREIR